MSIKVGAWNASAGFSNPEKAAGLLEVVRQIDADIWVVSEALEVNQDLEVYDDLKKDGFSIVIVDREPADERKNKMLMVLDRLGGYTTFLALAHRKAVKLNLPKASDRPALNIIGAHFDDRGEGKRLDMARAAIVEKFASPDPTVLAGDINAMHGGDNVAKRLKSRLVRAPAFLIPTPRNLGGRLMEMADGRTMHMLEEAGWVDADPLHQPTMKYPIIPGVQLDHIMVPSEIETHNFELNEKVNSNHKPIATTIEI